MTYEIYIVLSVIACAVVLFTTNLIRSDLVALLVLLSLLLTDILTIEEAFSGFSDSVVLIVIAMFIVSESLVFTGVASWLGRMILRYGGTNELRIMVLIMMSSGILGSFMSSTATAAIFIPITLFVAEKANLNHRRLLMPLSVAALISGMMTLIATTPNLIVNNVLAQEGLQELQFFSFTPFGICVLVVAIIFMAIFGRGLLSRELTASNIKKKQTIEQMLSSYGLTEKFHRLKIDEQSPLIDRAVARIKLREEYDLQLVVIERRVNRKMEFFKPLANTVLEKGDVLYLLGTDDLCFAACTDLSLIEISLANIDRRIERLHQAMGAVEVMLTPGSKLIGQSLETSNFRNNFNSQVLGIRRQGVPIEDKLSALNLLMGDVLLVSSDWKGILRLKENRDDFLTLSLPEEYRDVIPGKKRMPLVIAILISMVLSIITGVLPTVTATATAAVALILTRCINLESVYKIIGWQTVVLIAGILPLATALNKSGASNILTDVLMLNMGELAPIAMLVFLFCIICFIGLFVSNTATAVLIAPIAIEVALDLGVSPQAFAMTVAIACSAAYVTPVSSAPNLLVQSPGGYSFFDYVKIGFPLQLLTLICTVTLVWAIYL